MCRFAITDASRVEKVMRVLIAVLLTAPLAGVSAMVSAQAQQQPQVATAAPSSGDPNQILCEKQEVIGSRLGHRKVCMTRSQWEESRRQDRGEIEKVQTQRGLVGQGHNGG